MNAVGTYAVVPFISGLFNVVIDRLAPENLREWLMRQDATVSKLSKLRTSMIVVKRVLIDAEERQETDSDLKSWLNDVKHATYDAEDLIDEIQTEVLKRKLEYETQSTQLDVNQVLSSITAAFGRAVSGLDPFHQGIDARIGMIIQRFEAFSQLMDVLHLRSGVEKPRMTFSSSRVTSSLVDESMIYGRDAERDTIVRLLEDGVPDAGADDQANLVRDGSFLEGRIRVLAIVGMPGIGKTTLAQFIYNDPRVQDLFEFKTWTCVPEIFEVVEIIRSILNLLPEPSHDSRLPLSRFLNDLERNQRSLHRAVAGKRILVVLDDVWDDNLNAKWQALLNSLKSAAPGSAIIVTTRNEDIARMLHPTYILQLSELHVEDCWTLFKVYAFGGQHVVPDVKLEAIGRQIAKKCKGLPLSARALGGLLTCTSDSNEWDIIAKSNMWDLSSSHKEILPALLLSYNHLPPHLKRCFSYCSIFPKNYAFDKEKLVLLWMAEGFIEQGINDRRRMEDIGNIYFHDLLARSFFQASSSKKGYYVMHDLIHDLAVYVMGEFSFMQESNDFSDVMGRPRHFSFMQSKYDTLERFRLTACADCLRTFLPVGTFSNRTSYYLSSNLLQSIELFGCLRVLSFCGYKISSIPPSIGSLKHLRYLDFSSTLIEKLPDSICNLLNLQTLLLTHCEQLIQLPAMMRNLVHLRHLDIRGTSMLEEMPKHMGRLSCLQTLTDFVVGENCGISIRELGEFSQLRGSLKIYGLENVFSEADAFAANLKDKALLNELFLVQLEDCSVRGRKHDRLLHALKPHTNLRRLTIEYYEGNKFPNWLGDEAFCNLEFLHLQNCPNCVSLPPLGRIPFLKHLLVKDFDKLETLGAEFYGHHPNESLIPFKSLVTLKFERLPQWKKWVTYEGDVAAFPCLQELFVWECKELDGDFPSELPSLVVLNVKKCQRLTGVLPYSPLLRELSLNDFERIDLTGLAHFTRLTKLSLNWGKHVDSYIIAKAQEAIQHLTSLESLSISTEWTVCPGSWNTHSSIRSMSVSVFGTEEIGTFINSCSKLQYLFLQNFTSPLWLPAGHCRQLNFLGILSCDGLTEFPIVPEGDDMSLTSLYDLSIAYCKKLHSFSASGLVAPNLTTLSLQGCDSLQSLPDGTFANFPSLRFLSLQFFAQLESIPEDAFPQHLQTIRIASCEKVRSLPDTLSICMSLEVLDIDQCAALEMFPDGGLPPNLQKLKLYNCQSLNSFPVRISSTLKHMEIWKCPKIESFPAGVLPPSLESLHVFGCQKLIRNYTDWQLSRLICLKELSIGEFGDMESFPKDGSLPITLTVLKIDHCSELKSINCRELKRIGSLRELEIERCPVLQLFSDELPRSLCRLTIRRSRLLVKSFLNPDGDYADELSHITFLELDI